MYEIDLQEKTIIRELIRNPKISDNQIAIRTNVPLKTVNRKRKLLEERGMLEYSTFFNNPATGLKKSLFIIQLKEGITKKMILESFEHHQKMYYAKQIHSIEIGEQNGNICLLLTLESKKEENQIEIYNAEIVPFLTDIFGQGVQKTQVIPITSTLKKLRNYLPAKNMIKGILRADWPDSNIAIDD